MSSQHAGFCRCVSARSASPVSTSTDDPQKSFAPVTLKAPSVAFSRPAFIAWWTLMFLVHLIATSNHARVTKFYWRLPSTPLGEMVQLNDLTLPHSYSRAVAIVNVSVVLTHGAAMLRMVWNSARTRHLVCYVDDPKRWNSGSGLVVEPRGGFSDIFKRPVDSCQLFACDGAFGVEGTYFDLLLYSAKLVESFLQTQQISRVSSLVARRWLWWFGCVPHIQKLYRSSSLLFTSMEIKQAVTSRLSGQRLSDYYASCPIQFNNIC